jgi:hypothetical protein
MHIGVVAVFDVLMKMTYKLMKSTSLHENTAFTGRLFDGAVTVACNEDGAVQKVFSDGMESPDSGSINIPPEMRTSVVPRFGENTASPKYLPPILSIIPIGGAIPKKVGYKELDGFSNAALYANPVDRYGKQKSYYVSSKLWFLHDLEGCEIPMELQDVVDDFLRASEEKNYVDVSPGHFTAGPGVFYRTSSSASENFMTVGGSGMIFVDGAVTLVANGTAFDEFFLIATGSIIVQGDFTSESGTNAIVSLRSISPNTSLTKESVYLGVKTPGSDGLVIRAYTDLSRTRSRPSSHVRTTPTRIGGFEQIFDTADTFVNPVTPTCFAFSESSEASLPSNEDMIEFLRLQLISQFNVDSVESVEPASGKVFGGSFRVRHTSGSAQDECFVVVQQTKNALPNAGVATEPHCLDKYVVSGMAQTYRVAEDGFAFWQSGAYITTNLRGEFVLSKDRSAPLYKTTKGMLSVGLSDLGGAYRLNDSASTTIDTDRTVSITTQSYNDPPDGGADPYTPSADAYISKYTIVPYRPVVAALAAFAAPAEETSTAVVETPVYAEGPASSGSGGGNDSVDEPAYTEAIEVVISRLETLLEARLDALNGQFDMFFLILNSPAYITALNLFSDAMIDISGVLGEVRGDNTITASVDAGEYHNAGGILRTYEKDVSSAKNRSESVLISDTAVSLFMGALLAVSRADAKPIGEIADAVTPSVLKQIMRSRYVRIRQVLCVVSLAVPSHVLKDGNTLGILVSYITELIGTVSTTGGAMVGQVEMVSSFVDTLELVLGSMDEYVDDVTSVIRSSRMCVNAYGSFSEQEFNETGLLFDSLLSKRYSIMLGIEDVVTRRDSFKKYLAGLNLTSEDIYTDPDKWALVLINDLMDAMELDALQTAITHAYSTAEDDRNKASIRRGKQLTFNDFYAFLLKSASTIKEYADEVTSTEWIDMVIYASNASSIVISRSGDLSRIVDVFDEIYSSVGDALASGSYSLVKERIEHAESALASIRGVGPQISDSIKSDFDKIYTKYTSLLAEKKKTVDRDTRDAECFDIIGDIVGYINANDAGEIFSAFATEAALYVDAGRSYLQTLPDDSEDTGSDFDDAEAGNLEDLGSIVCSIAAPYDSFVRYRPMNARVTGVVTDVSTAFFRNEDGTLFVRNTSSLSRKMEFTCTVQSSPGLVPRINENVIRRYGRDENLVVYFDAERIDVLPTLPSKNSLIVLETDKSDDIGSMRYETIERSDDGRPVKTSFRDGSGNKVVYDVTKDVITLAFSLTIVFGDMVQERPMSKFVPSDETFEYFTRHYGELVAHQIQSLGKKVITADQQSFDCTYVSQSDLSALRAAGFLITENPDGSKTARCVTEESCPVVTSTLTVYGRKAARYTAGATKATTDLMKGEYETADGRIVGVLDDTGTVLVSDLPFTVGVYTYHSLTEESAPGPVSISFPADTLDLREAIEGIDTSARSIITAASEFGFLETKIDVNGVTKLRVKEGVLSPDTSVKLDFYSTGGFTVGLTKGA